MRTTVLGPVGLKDETREIEPQGHRPRKRSRRRQRRDLLRHNDEQGGGVDAERRTTMWMEEFRSKTGVTEPTNTPPNPKHPQNPPILEL